MTPMDIFMFGLYSGIFWLMLVLVFTIIGVVTDSYDRFDGAVNGVAVGGLVGGIGFLITLSLSCILAVVLAIITALG